MIGFRCECGAAIDCTYPKCKEGVETGGKDITDRLQDYARDYTTTTYHDDLIREAVTKIVELRQQLAALTESYAKVTERVHMVGGYLDQIKDSQKQVTRLRDAIEAIWTNPNWKPDTMPRALIDQLQTAYKGAMK